jgi:hypothetical protein
MINTLLRSLLASWGAAKGDAFHAVGATLLGSMTFVAEMCPAISTQPNPAVT